MRVLHVIPSVAERSGGPATAIVPMCRALMQQGMDVLLISTDAGLGDREVTEVPAKLFPAQLGESFKYSRPLASWLSANVRKFDVSTFMQSSTIRPSRPRGLAGVLECLTSFV